MAEFFKRIEKHLQDWGPLLLMAGLVEKEGEKVVLKPQLSKAGGKIFGLGKDDEGIMGAIAGEMKTRGGNIAKAGQNIFIWYTYKIKDFQKYFFRQTIITEFSEFKNFLEGDLKRGKFGKHSMGMEYAIGFCQFLNSLPDDKTRIDVCVAMNFFPRREPAWWKTTRKIKKTKLINLIDGSIKELKVCNKALEKFLLG